MNSKNIGINIEQCVMYGCTDVRNVNIDLELVSNPTSIQSVRVRGASCSQCAEEYYDSIDLIAIEKFEQLLNELFPNP